MGHIHAWSPWVALAVGGQVRRTCRDCSTSQTAPERIIDPLAADQFTAIVRRMLGLNKNVPED